MYVGPRLAYDRSSPPSVSRHMSPPSLRTPRPCDLVRASRLLPAFEEFLSGLDVTRECHNVHTPHNARQKFASDSLLCIHIERFSFWHFLLTWLGRDHHVCGMSAPGCRKQNALLLNLLLLCVTLTPQFIASPPEAETATSQALGHAVVGAQSQVISQDIDDVSKHISELTPSATLLSTEDSRLSSEVVAEPARKSGSSPISSTGEAQGIRPILTDIDTSEDQHSIVPIHGTPEAPASRLIGDAIHVSNGTGTEIDSRPKPGATSVPAGDPKPELLQQVLFMQPCSPV